MGLTIIKRRDKPSTSITVSHASPGSTAVPGVNLARARGHLRVRLVLIAEAGEAVADEHGDIRAQGPLGAGRTDDAVYFGQHRADPALLHELPERGHQVGLYRRMAGLPALLLHHKPVD